MSSIYNHFRSTVIHKGYVFRAAIKMGDYLESKGEKELASELLKRANIHDDSKFRGEEAEELCKLYKDDKSFKNPEIELTEPERKIIEIHWKTNRHHPEYFDNVLEMEDLDIVEMVCDWYARSMEYKTDFLDFVQTRQDNRFHFPEEVFKKVWYYCNVLNK